MADIILFTPESERDAAENVRDFIGMCRDQLTVFGADLVFDSPVWDVTESVALKGRGSRRERISFCILATARKGSVEMVEPFRSFAKAYIRYMQGMRPTKCIHPRLTALRALESALAENGRQPDPVQVDTGILNRAAQLIGERFGPKETAYRAGVALEGVAEFMAKNRLIAVSVSWHNPIRRPPAPGRVGKRFDELRRARLPTVAALEALPKVFRLAKDPKDVSIVSIAAILCAAPDRINEVLLLPKDCEVHSTGASGAAKAYGLRWLPAKGADPMVKWVIPSMAEVVAEAIAKIRRCTETARDVANWYEVHPRQIYLPKHLEHLRNRELLSTAELADILFIACSKTSGRNWARRRRIPILRQCGRVFVRFADVERAVLRMLPAGFPVLNAETGLKYSEALLVVHRHQFHARKARYRCVIEAVTSSYVNEGLGSGSKHGKPSIFDRFGFTERDGSPIKVTTHQFRHYLNTLAQAGGMSQLDIAKWSGRKDIRQNVAYDHVTSEQMLVQIREAIGDEHRMFGPLAQMPKGILIPRDEFARLKVPTAHTTDVGFCIHDYTMLPCQLHLDCINCEELVCVKGDVVKTTMIHQRLEEAKALLAKAEDAVKSGYAGGDRWMEHHRATVERLDQLCQILDDPDVPTGSFIQLADSRTPSRLRQAAEERAALESHSTQPKVMNRGVTLRLGGSPGVESGQ